MCTLVCAVTVLVGVLVVTSGGRGAPGPQASAALASDSRASGLRASAVSARNVSFYYNGTVPLAGSDPSALKEHLGSPGVVVTTPTDDEVGTVDAIHRIGAKAYRYVQFYWAPVDREYHGIDLSEHPEWAFCRTGSTPSHGRTDGAGADWLLLDLNERALLAQIDTLLAGYEAAGWDGVFIDRGEAATQYAADSAGRPVWHRSSTCTEDPAVAGARFADAHVGMLARAHANGLEAMMNTGKSPFDEVAPLRPDPAKAACRARDWERCTFLSDAWRHLDLVVNETAGRPTDLLWDRTFHGNKRSERHRRYGGRTIGLITTASLGGVENQTRRNVYYQWSRIKLFDLPVAVNTGDDRCAQSTEPVCNRYGTYPELVDTVLGEPLSAAPESTRCRRKDEVHCVWMRRYTGGTSVLNVDSRRRDDVTVRLGTSGCRHVYDVWSGQPLAGNRCVTKVRVDLHPWSGRPLRLSRHPW
ncbi:MAG TPA: hypothetical protein VFG72_01040 [Marmoricola sp.]|nr:hypothetical protein [Marmoricola sp.]